uniref:X-linked retinitis pigmentosa GTPase regulator n=1 Tax=Anthurium amnicola TaxID=1678845 RepID=A0A1D1Y3B4_9ARAE
MWRKAIPGASRAANLSARRLLGTSRRHLSRAPWPPPPEGPGRFVALWGNGDYGRLGLGSLSSQWRPAACTFFADDDPPVSVACGGAHTLFLTEKGHVFATGLNNFGQLGITTDTSHTLVPIKVSMFPKKILQIAAGYHHSAAITEDGELFVWGNNSNGQLGLGRKAESFVSAPTRVDCLVGACVKMVALGSEHSIAVTDEGNALSWGAGGCGRLGHGLQSGILGFSGSSSEYTPRLIKNFEEVKVKKIAAGLLHSACIDERGCVFVFGEETTGKLAFGALKNTSTPSIVHELPFSEEIACGGYHTCVITAGGQLYTWGSNENGCLGLGFTDMVDTPQRVENSFMKFPISEVSCGWKHAAVISGGNLLTWGWGGANGTFFEDGLSSGGQLGHGNDLDCFEPMAVNIGKHVRAVQVSGGFNHTGAIFEFV